MEFLVEFEVEVPAGTPDAEVEQHQRAESAAAAKPEEIAGDQRAITVGPAPGLSGYVRWPILRSLRRSPAICSRHADVTCD